MRMKRKHTPTRINKRSLRRLKVLRPTIRIPRALPSRTLTPRRRIPPLRILRRPRREPHLRYRHLSPLTLLLFLSSPRPQRPRILIRRNLSLQPRLHIQICRASLLQSRGTYTSQRGCARAVVVVEAGEWVWIRSWTWTCTEPCAAPDALVLRALLQHYLCGRRWHGGEDADRVVCVGLERTGVAAWLRNICCSVGVVWSRFRCAAVG